MTEPVSREIFSLLALVPCMVRLRLDSLVNTVAFMMRILILFLPFLQLMVCLTQATVPI